jgi:hypothetical protein
MVIDQSTDSRIEQDPDDKGKREQRGKWRKQILEAPMLLVAIP